MLFDEPSYSDEEKELVSRYEEIKKNGETCYFDDEEYAIIFDYYINQEDFSTCFEILKSAEYQHPMSPDIMDCKARLLAAKGSYSEALSVINIALKIDDKNTDLLLTKGKVLLSANQGIEAAQIFKIIANQNDGPGHENILAEIGIAYRNANLFELSKKYFLDAINENKENEDLYSELAITYELCDEYELARQTYEKILDINPYSRQTWNSIGNILLALKQYDKASEAYDYAYTIDSNDTYSLFQKGNALFCANRFEEAIEAYEEYMDLVGYDAESYVSIGECYECLDRYEDAINIYQRALDLDPDNDVVMSNLCAAYVNFGKCNEALYWIDEAIKRNKNKATYYLFKAEALINLELRDKALSCYKKCLKLDPDQTLAYIAIGNIHFDNQNYQTALLFLEKAYDLDNEAEDIKLFLSMTHYKLGHFDKAKALLEQACSEKENSLSLFLEVCDEAKQNPIFKSFFQ